MNRGVFDCFAFHCVRSAAWNHPRFTGLFDSPSWAEVADVTAVMVGDAACTVHSVSTSAIVCTLGRISVEGIHDVAVTTVFGSDVKVAAFSAQGYVLLHFFFFFFFFVSLFVDRV